MCVTCGTRIRSESQFQSKSVAHELGLHHTQRDPAGRVGDCSDQLEMIEMIEMIYGKTLPAKERASVL
jgi:hypothetical protein